MTLPAAFDAVMTRAIAVQPAAPFPSAVTLVQAMDDALRAPKKVFGKTLLLGQASPLSAPAPVDELEDGWPSNVPPEVAKSDPPAAPVSLASVEVATTASRHPSTASGLGPAQSPSASPPAAAAEAPIPPLAEYPSAQYPIAQYAGGEPSISLPLRSRRGLWIGIGVVLFVGMLLAGGVGGYLFLRDGTPAPSAASAAPAMSLGSAAPAEVAAPAAPPPAAPSATPEAQPIDAGPALASVVLSCTPACRELDSITCDDQPQKLDAQDRLELEPGNHQCVLTKAGYQPLKLRLELKAGATERRNLVLVRPAAAAGPSEPKRPCGTFINPCP